MMLSVSMANVMMGCREESDLDDKAGVVMLQAWLGLKALAWAWPERAWG